MNSSDKHAVIAVWLSLIGNIVLTALKFLVGLAANSQVLIADGAHNAGDIAATLATLSAMRVSKRPADEDHPYGHGKAEVIGAGFVAVILAAASLFIGYHAVTAFFYPAGKPSFIALLAAVVSLVVKQALYVYTFDAGKKNNSKGLIATAYDHLADVYASLAAAVGIALAMFGERFSIEILKYGDPAAGVAVACLVLKLAIHMARQSVDILMEKNVDAAKLDAYSTLIASVPYVKRIDRIRAREHGHYIIVDVRVAVLGDLTVRQGHDISRAVKEKMMKRHKDVGEVLVHVNPWYE